MGQRTSIKSLTLSEVFKGIGYGVYHSKNHLFNSYVVIPTGLLVLFTILYGLNQLLTKVIKIEFPCSVLGMLINLIFLCVLNVISEMDNKQGQALLEQTGFSAKVSRFSAKLLVGYLRLIRPLMNFTLKWINVFFIPSFIILPLSDPITFIECLKIAAVFVVGFLLLFCIDVYLILGLQWVLDQFGLLRHHHVVNEDSSEHPHRNDQEDAVELESLSYIRPADSNEAIGNRDDITTIEFSNIPGKGTSENETVGTIVTQVLLPTDKNPFESELPSQPELVYLGNGVGGNTPSRVSDESQPRSFPDESVPELQIISGFGGNASENTKKVIIFITNYIDWIVYGTLFVVSLPLYYISSIHTFLPYHLGVTILAYYIALLVPQRFPLLKKIAHPILILTAEILFVLFIGSLMYHHGQPKGFLDDLKYYKTGKNYLNLFNNKVLAKSGQLVGLDQLPQDDFTSTPKWPGCGDVLSSLMDASIVSLLLPMYTHRKDFVRNFWVLMPPLLVSVALTFFCYPQICYHIGIAPTRSIGFIGRSVTLALGTPLITSLGGSVSLMACSTILSGICGVLVGDLLFRLLRVPKNDFVTRGVSLGVNCGAIATAHLLNVDPRAALMSSLSFSIFGTVMVIMAAIGSVRDLIHLWVGL